MQHVRQPLDDGCGVLVTPNHTSHADCFAVYDLAERVGEPIPVPSGRRERLSVTELTRLLETRVQGLLNERLPNCRRAARRIGHE